jgi:hypothetical protein
MTGHRWLGVLIGIAVALPFTWLLLIDAVARRCLTAKTLQRSAAYHRFSSSGALPRRNRRRRQLLVLAVLVIHNVVVLGLPLSRGPDRRCGTCNTRRRSGVRLQRFLRWRMSMALDLSQDCIYHPRHFPRDREMGAS